MVYVISCMFSDEPIEYEVDTLDEVEDVLDNIAAKHGDETILEWIASGDLIVYEP